jgi:N-acetyl-anhydromuramyl-L-alanine amidase AmpD
MKLQLVKYIVCHHTATSFETSPDAIKQGSLGWLEQNDRLMYFGQGYKCDYHWMVDQYGNVYQGQPESMIAFNSGNNEVNNASIAVSAIGNLQESGMPLKQFIGFLKTLMVLKKRYPQATIIKHSDVISTACPGQNFPYNKLINFSKIRDLNPASWDFQYMVAMLFWGEYKVAENINPDKPLTRAEYAVLRSKEKKWL